MPEEQVPKKGDWRSRISINPEVCFGRPCIRGTRIWVSLIVDNLAEGVSEAELLEAYPQLVPEDIRAALSYAAELTRVRFVDIPLADREHMKIKLDENIDAASQIPAACATRSRSSSRSTASRPFNLFPWKRMTTSSTACSNIAPRSGRLSWPGSASEAYRPRRR